MERIATWKLEKERKKVAKCIFCCLPAFCLFFHRSQCIRGNEFSCCLVKKNRKKIGILKTVKSHLSVPIFSSGRVQKGARLIAEKFSPQETSIPPFGFQLALDQVQIESQSRGISSHPLKFIWDLKLYILLKTRWDSTLPHHHYSQEIGNNIYGVFCIIVKRPKKRGSATDFTSATHTVVKLHFLSKNS